MRTAVLLAAMATCVPAAAPGAARADCYDELDARGVPYKRAQKPGIALGVEVDGPIGGVTYTSIGDPKRKLVLDCSLVVSLAEAGAYMKGLGIDHARYSSAYQVRNVRGTHRPSKHSFGLAIDVHVWSGPDYTLSVEKDFEQGLGDDVDCVGAPLTPAGATLKVLECQLRRSGLFFLVLNPDTDADHYNHYHLEARAWADRPTLRSEKATLH